VLAVAAVAVLAGLLVGAALAGPLLGDGPDDDPGTVDPVRFEAVTEANDDRIVFRFAPNTATVHEYRASYGLTENGSTVESVTNRTVTLSADEPFEVTVTDRRANAAYGLDITIHRDDVEVYGARIVVSRATPA
jgi:hypothetical protein